MTLKSSKNLVLELLEPYIMVNGGDLMLLLKESMTDVLLGSHQSKTRWLVLTLQIVMFGYAVFALIYPGLLQRNDFWNEASKLADLHHPNVVAFYGVVLDGPGGSIATVTEYMVNGSLRTALLKNAKYVPLHPELSSALICYILMSNAHKIGGLAWC